MEEKIKYTMIEIRKDIFGYFEDYSDTPTYDPGTDTVCPICGNKLSDKRKTISLYRLLDDRSWFYRVDKHCYEALSSEEKDQLDWSLIDNLPPLSDELMSWHKSL